MNKDIARRWVEALRSGRFEQTKGALARKLDNGKVGYCCLGVLCELAVEENVIPSKVAPPEYTDRFVFGTGDMMPGVEVDTWASAGGLDDRYRLPVSDEIAEDLREAGITVRHNMAFLPELNDNLGLTFNEIADLIEAAYLND